MNLLTILFSSILHIILVLIFEGVFLFLILLPIINNIVKNITLQTHLPLYNNVLENNLLLPMQIPSPPSNNIYNCKTGKYDINPNYIIQNTQYNDKMNKFLSSQFNLGNIKNVLTTSQNKLLESCINNEQTFIEKQKKVPSIVYILIMLSIVTLFGIVIMISKKFNIPINYKFSIINSIIVFILICGYSTLLLWYSVFTQPYHVNINNKLFQTFKNVYNSI